MRSKITLLTGLVMICFTQAKALKYTFTGSGSYFNQSNWAGGLIPPNGTTDTIIISGNAIRYPEGYDDWMIGTNGVLTIKSGYSLTFETGSHRLFCERATINIETGATFYAWGWIMSLGNLNINGTFWCSSIPDAMYITNQIIINGTFEMGGPGQFFSAYTPITINNGGILHIRNGSACSFDKLTINDGGVLNNEGSLYGNGEIIAGNFTNSGIIAPGNSPGLIEITGDYSPSSSAVHNFEISGTASNQYDQLSVSGTAHLNGTLNVSLINGFTPSTSHDISILTGTVSGSFATVNIPASYSLVYNSNSVVLRHSAILPVSFIEFDAKRNEAQLQLKWKIENEHNVDKYEVQKSSDGRNYSTIGSVNANQSPSYFFSVASPKHKAYYRIKSVDFDGKYKHSSIIFMNEGQSSIIMRSYPSHATYSIIVEHKTSGKTDRITITSSDGRIVKSIFPVNGTMQTKIDISDLSRANYYVTYYATDGNLSTTTFIKQ